MAYQAVHAGNANDPIQAPDAYINRFPYITNERRRKFAGKYVGHCYFLHMVKTTSIQISYQIRVSTYSFLMLFVNALHYLAK